MELKRHQVYGLSFESDFAFSVPLPEEEGRESDLRFVAGETVADAGWGPPEYASELVNEDGQPLVELFRDGNRELLSFTGRATFLMERSVIRYSAEDDPAIVQTLFLASVLAYFLERRGVLALHGSAISVGDKGVCFLAASGTGKSSLAAAFVKEGHGFLTDDVVALDRGPNGFIVHPAFPEIKINPDVGSFLLGAGFDSLPAVNPVEAKRAWRIEPEFAGRRTAVDLRRIFVLSREGDSVGVEQGPSLSRLEASIEILRSGFTPNLAEASGLAPERLDRISTLTEEVPVKRLTLGSEIADLPRVVESLVRDVLEG